MNDIIQKYIKSCRKLEDKETQMYALMSFFSLDTPYPFQGTFDTLDKIMPPDKSAILKELLEEHTIELQLSVKRQINQICFN